MLKLLNIIAFPITLIYGVIVFVRNKLYDWGVWSSEEYNFPVISIGNLSLGGTGKTPHVEYLIRLLSFKKKLASLSRGYGRKTSGFLLVNEDSTSIQVGDEPLQIKKKFKDIVVAVDEKRVHGIEQLCKTYPDIDVILLDDAFQHRAVRPRLNILVTPYNNLFTDDTLFPSGRLREWKSGSQRADIIIVSKSDKNLSPFDKNRTKEYINPVPNQQVYFSYISYGSCLPFNEAAHKMADTIDNSHAALLITGIAHPDSMLDKVKEDHKDVDHIKFKDHHIYRLADTNYIKNRFAQLPGNNKLVITTEKDIMRLSLPEISEALQEVPIFYIPIEVCFHGDDGENFERQVLDYVNAYPEMNEFITDK